MWAPFARALMSVAIALLVAAALASPANAVIRAAVTIDGPSSNILSLGGVAMAPDGTGGLVYLKEDQGEPHVFVSQFIHDQWLPAQRVDTALPYDSSWPQIAAGDGGRLVVVWAQSFAEDFLTGVPIRRMYSATLMPGASSFLPQIAFDSNLSSADANGDQAVSELYPSLAMNAVGQAYAVYRVVTTSCTGTTCGNPAAGTVYRPGDSFADYRLARFNGETWSVLGAINRNTDFSVAPGTADNSPQVTIDSSGHGVVAFQEPDNSGYDRIWARRLFGASIGQILQVSPSTLNGQPVDGDADAFNLAGTDNGGALITYRQEPSQYSSSAPQMFANELYPSSSPGAAQFAGPEVLGTDAAGLGSPASAMNDQAGFAVAYADQGSMQLSEGNPSNINPFQPLGAVTGDARPGLTIGPDGFAVSAWTASNPAGQPVVDVEQLPANGSPVQARLAATTGGAVANLLLAGSGQGDALVAFEQGVGSGAQIAATVVQAPPPMFAAQAPTHWVKPTNAVFTWQAAPRALGSVTYSPVVDGIVRARGLTGTSYRLDPRGLQTGQYDVAVIATDNAGQQTLSTDDTLMVDASPEASATVDQRGRRVVVRVSDGRQGRSPGLDLSHTTVRFGDGSRPMRLRGGRHPQAVVFFRHNFRRAGWFTIRIRARDRAGFVRNIILRVRVP